MIVGDANMCEVATFLKVGTTAIVLKMIEDEYLPDLTLANAVASLHEISRDITCTAQVRLSDGRRLTAVQLQWEYLERAHKYVEQEDDTPDNREVLSRWETVLSGLETEPLSLAARARLGREVPSARGLPRARWSRVVRSQAAAGGPPVPRRST